MLNLVLRESIEFLSIFFCKLCSAFLVRIGSLIPLRTLIIFNYSLPDILVVYFIPTRFILRVILWRKMWVVLSQTFKPWTSYLIRLCCDCLELLDKWLLSQTLFLIIFLIFVFFFGWNKSCIDVFKDSNVHLCRWTIKYSLFQCFF